MPRWPPVRALRVGIFAVERSQRVLHTVAKSLCLCPGRKHNATDKRNGGDTREASEKLITGMGMHEVPLSNGRYSAVRKCAGVESASPKVKPIHDTNEEHRLGRWLQPPLAGRAAILP